VTPTKTALTGLENTCSPFLKWAGGKRWFASRHSDVVPPRYGRYIEPFLGSGALFFALQPKNAILADLNGALVETYMAIKASWKPVVSILRRYHRLHSRTFYYNVRSSRPRTRPGHAGTVYIA
jgi:DNA adenine methylase